MRRLLSLLTFILLTAAAAAYAQAGADPKKHFAGRHETLKTDVPATKDGVNARPETVRPLDRSAYAAGLKTQAVSFRLTDQRQVITRTIGGGLLLRVVKERSASQQDFGWRVEVVRKPYLRSSRNLLYHSRRTLGAHPSQVYAWHVTTGEFPNVRVLGVWGRPLNIRIELIDPVAEGDGSDSKFVSGEIRISWEAKQNR
jgi:hypothetical protein